MEVLQIIGMVSGGVGALVGFSTLITLAVRYGRVLERLDRVEREAERRVGRDVYLAEQQTVTTKIQVLERGLDELKHSGGGGGGR